MAIAYINAVRECTYPFKRFYTRQLLIWLADAAYTEEQVAKFGNGMRVGELWRDEQWMMECLDIDRRQTITDCLNELLGAGAIKRVRRQRRSTITFVDIGWLKKHKRLDATSNQASGLTTDNVSSNSQTPNAASKATPNEASKSTPDVVVGNAQRGVRVVRSSEVVSKSSSEPANDSMPPQAEAKPETAPKAEPTSDEIRAAKIAHFHSLPQCKCEANSPFCTKCYANPSVEDEIGAIA